MKAINREILSIAIPSIITNITTPLLALMDVVIVGHMGSPDYIAAIAVGGTIFNMLYWLFAFLRMGSSGLTAQANGAGNKSDCDLLLTRGLLVAFTASIMMIALQGFIIRFANHILEVDDSVSVLVYEYFSILIWGAPASLGTFVLTGWFLGMKNAKTPMWIAFAINIANIAISLLLVFVFGMKVKGVATGTLAAQWIGFAMGLAIALVRHRPYPPSLSSIVKADELKQFFSINADIFLRTLCLIAVTVWFTRTGAAQGTIILAVNTLLMQFFIIFSYFMDGFAFAGESLCGNCAGQNDRTHLKATIRALFGWGMTIVIIFTTIYATAGDSIMRLLSDDTGVIKTSADFTAWAVAIPIAGFAAFIWDGIYIGLTRTHEMLISIAVSSAVYFTLYFILFPLIGNHSLWLAFITYLFSRGLVLTLLSRRAISKSFQSDIVSG